LFQFHAKKSIIMPGIYGFLLKLNNRSVKRAFVSVNDMRNRQFQ